MSIAKYLHSATWFLPVRIILSSIYGILISMRNFCYNKGLFKIHRVKTPVISVGNISAGGSGKTILVQSLVQYFLDQNKNPSILSRGYGRQTKGLLVVANMTAHRASVLESGDEPFLLAQNFPGVPVVVSENRVVGAQYLEDNFTPDVIILDDGFQHRRLFRDLDIVIIDYPSTQKQHLLPWGNFREKAHELHRADQILYSKNARGSKQGQNLSFTLEKKVYNSQDSSLNLDELSGDYGLFAGLGNPQYFFDSVNAIHGPAHTQISFPDHAQYTQGQLDMITDNSCSYWITTQKDYIKLDPGFCEAHSIYFIRVKSELPAVVLNDLKKYFN